jgi:hypothetical protein
MSDEEYSETLHAMRNSLHIIALNAEILAVSLDPQVVRRAAGITEAAHNLNGMLNKLLRKT